MVGRHGNWYVYTLLSHLLALLILCVWVQVFDPDFNPQQVWTRCEKGFVVLANALS